MLKHYIKFAFRNFKSNKVIFGGSLLTLCLGALCISLLFSYVYNELTMNNSLKNKDDIYITVIKQTPQSIPSIFNIKDFFRFDYTKHPEIKSISDVQNLPEKYIKLTYDNNTFSVSGLGVDSTFLNVFDFPLLRGDKSTALNLKNKILLTENMAKKIFGNEDPIGKTISAQFMGKFDYTVSGILKNPAANSSLQYNFIMATYGRGGGMAGGNFLHAEKNFNKSAFENKIKHLGDSRDDYKNSEVSLVSLSDIYFNKGSFLDRNIFSRYGDKKSLNTLYIIMLVILIISVLNFSNLQVIYANKGIKANTIKRINGAENSHVSQQKVVEIVVLVILAAVLNTIMYQLLLPYFNNLTQVFLAPPLQMVFLLNSCVLVCISILGLIYPVVVSFRIPLIKGLSNKSVMPGQLKGRRVIIVAQYTLTFVLLISSVIVVKQLQMMLNKNLGFETENIVSTQIIGQLSWGEREKARNRYEFVKNSLTENPNIASFTQGVSPLEGYPMDWKVAGEEHKYDTQNSLFINLNYDEALGLEIIEGRFFEKERDSSNGFKLVINEAAKKYWNITNIQESKFWNKLRPPGSEHGNGGEYEVIGVVKDFNYEHLSSTPKPLLMLYADNMDDRFLIKFENGAEKAGLATVENLFKNQNPNEIFSYKFLKDDVAALYQKEKQLGINYVLFTLIALIISAVGLFTIALYDTQRRVKEIAVRKVNGARVREILILLNKSIVKWIVVAFAIASPIAYLVMQKWLENFAYKTSISWWIFAAAGFFTLTIALLTVSWRSYKAATANPVKSLRTE